MCEHDPTYESAFRFVRADGLPGFCDACLAPLMIALNAGGLTTVASCCGHGHRPGNIVLKDGRELVIMPDFETARSIDHLWPDIHGDTARLSVIGRPEAIIEVAVVDDAPAAAPHACKVDSGGWCETCQIRPDDCGVAGLCFQGAEGLVRTIKADAALPYDANAGIPTGTEG